MLLILAPMVADKEWFWSWRGCTWTLL